MSHQTDCPIRPLYTDAASTSPLVVVDDDADTCDLLVLLGQSVQRATIPFVDPRDFFTWIEREKPSTLVAVVDVRMPQMSGLELMQRGLQLDTEIRFVLISAYADVRLAVECMKRGASDFLEKPFSRQQMVDAITLASRDLEAPSRSRTALADAQQRLGRLTPRQREVLIRVARGDANKVIAFDLDISPKTVEIHRGELMRRMGARSVAQLVRIAVQLEHAGVLERLPD